MSNIIDNTDDLVAEIIPILEEYNPIKNWGMSAKDAAYIIVGDPDYYLCSTTIDDHLDMGIHSLEVEAYKILGMESNFTPLDFPDEAILKILERTTYAQKVPVYTDLSNKTEMTLSNGEIVKFNQHLLNKENDEEV